MKKLLLTLIITAISMNTAFATYRCPEPSNISSLPILAIYENDDRDWVAVTDSIATKSDDGELLNWAFVIVDKTIRNDSDASYAQAKRDLLNAQLETEFAEVDEEGFWNVCRYHIPHGHITGYLND